jgi:Protein kinase domain/Tetratricopeptide repeat
MDCLDDNTVNAYIEHALPVAARLRVSAHLDACEVCLQITCAAAGGVTADQRGGASNAATVSDPATATTEAAQVQTVGRYVLRSVIGRGGVGVVYRAHDPQLDREVALKIVRTAGFAQAEVRTRLSREARAMARVKHPHVVAVYDAGELHDGVFIAMELVEGETLARWQAAPGRTWRERVRRYLDAGRGLAAAHAAGIVHRDFKPDNVLVDRLGRAAVSDFGLAVEPIATGSSPANLATARDPVTLDTAPPSHAGALRGTPRYMSPEQFGHEPVDARSDQFSFAVALFEALYGRAPFDGATVSELRSAVLDGALRERPVETEVPARLHRMLVRALAVRPRDRYPSMTALLDDLGRAIRPARRALLPALGIACAALAAVAGLSIVRSSAGTRRASPPSLAPPAAELDARRIAILVPPFTNRTGDPRLDDTLDLAVADVLARSTRIDPAAGLALVYAATQLGGQVTAVDGLATAMAARDGRPVLAVHGSVAREPAGYVLMLDAQPAGRPRYTGTTHAATLDDLVGAAAQLGAGLRGALGDAPAAGSIDHILTRSIDALHAYRQGQTASMTSHYDDAVARFRVALAADPELVEARAALGLALYNLAEHAAAVQELDRAVQHIDRMAERPRLMLLGDYHGTLGNYRESIAAYEQLLARWPGDPRAQINVTATAVDAGAWPLALELARRAVKDHPELPVNRANAVLAELGNTRLDEAVRDGAAMLAAVERPSGFAFAFTAMAHALVGRGGEARAIHDRLATLEPAFADQARADLALYEGRLDDAEALLRRAVDPALARHAPDTVASQLVALARLRLRRGDRAGAIQAATAAMGSNAVRLEYMAASLVLEAGGSPKIAAQIAAQIDAWTHHAVADWRLYGKLLAGDLARAQHHAADAVAAYLEASQTGSLWLSHERLGRAYLAAGAAGDAVREYTWCVAHRGEASVFITPSMSYLPEAELGLARSLDLAHAPAVAAYQVLLDHAPAAQHDPWTDEARRRLTATRR